MATAITASGEDHMNHSCDGHNYGSCYNYGGHNDSGHLGQEPQQISFVNIQQRSFSLQQDRTRDVAMNEVPQSDRHLGQVTTLLSQPRLSKSLQLPPRNLYGQAELTKRVLSIDRLSIHRASHAVFPPKATSWMADVTMTSEGEGVQEPVLTAKMIPRPDILPGYGNLVSAWKSYYTEDSFVETWQKMTSVIEQIDLLSILRNNVSRLTQAGISSIDSCELTHVWTFGCHGWLQVINVNAGNYMTLKMPLPTDAEDHNKHYADLRAEMQNTEYISRRTNLKVPHIYFVESLKECNSAIMVMELVNGLSGEYFFDDDVYNYCATTNNMKWLAEKQTMIHKALAQAIIDIASAEQAQGPGRLKFPSSTCGDQTEEPGTMMLKHDFCMWEIFQARSRRQQPSTLLAEHAFDIISQSLPPRLESDTTCYLSYPDLGAHNILVNPDTQEILFHDLDCLCFVYLEWLAVLPIRSGFAHSDNPPYNFHGVQNRCNALTAAGARLNFSSMLAATDSIVGGFSQNHLGSRLGRMVKSPTASLIEGLGVLAFEDDPYVISWLQSKALKKLLPLISRSYYRRQHEPLEEACCITPLREPHSPTIGNHDHAKV